MIHTALQRFLRDSGGNLTPMFALTMIPVLGLIGISVDYTQSSTRKATLDNIAALNASAIPSARHLAVMLTDRFNGRRSSAGAGAERTRRRTRRRGGHGQRIARAVHHRGEDRRRPIGV